MPPVRKFLANYSFLVAGDLAAKLLAFWATVHLARVLGAGLFGNLAFALAMVSYFALVAGRGLDAYGTREVARDRNWLDRALDSFLGLRLTASAVAAVALLAVIPWLELTPTVRWLAYLYGLTLISGAVSLRWLFQGLERMDQVAVSQVVGQSAYAGAVLLLVDGPADVLLVPLLLFAGELLGAGYLVLRYRVDRGPLRWLGGRTSIWGEIARGSLAVGLSGALGMVLYNFDLVMLGFMRPAEEVGLYHAAYRFILFFGAFITLHADNLFPAISRTRDSPDALRRLSDTSLRYTLLITVPLAVGGSVLARPTIELVFGDEYVAAGTALAILLWVLPVMALRSVYRLALIAFDEFAAYLWIHLAAAGLNVALNLWLIPRHGFEGAAAATVVSEFVLFPLAYLRLAAVVRRLPALPHLWRPLVCSLPMALAVHWTGGHVLVRVLVGVLVYSTGAWLSGALDPREIARAVASGSATAPRASVDGSAEPSGRRSAPGRPDGGDPE